MSKSDKSPDICVNTQPIIYPFKAVFTKIKTFLLDDIIHKSGIQKRMCQIMARHCFKQKQRLLICSHSCLCFFVYTHSDNNVKLQTYTILIKVLGDPLLMKGFDNFSNFHE